MLLRAYRLTDRLGVVILKTGAEFSALLLDGSSILLGTLGARTYSVLKAIISVIIFFLSGIAAILWWIGTRLFAILRFAAGVFTGVGRGSAQTVGRSMARRSARAEIDTGLAEDPLQRQNRMLSALVVVVLAALVGVVVWASSRDNNSVPFTPGVINLNAGDDSESTSQPEQPVSLNLSTPIPTATPLPEVLQARGTIAFVAPERGQKDIWAVPVGSNTPIRLTNSAHDERDPAWSPDGRQLAYASRKDGNWELYIYDLISGDTTRMTYNLGFEAGPAWSPQGGEYLVYEAYQNDTHLDIFLIRSDGAEPPVRLPGASAAPDFSPAWSPDGRRIAFVSWRDGNQDIYVFSLDTQEVFNLTNTPNRHEDYPAWSPDGNYLAYSAVEAGIESVFVQAAGAPDTTPQVFRRGRTPSWSPDGNSIVFAVDGSDSTFITVAPFGDTGVATEVIQAPYGASHPVWTSTTLPPSLINSGGLPLGVTEPLYVEQSQEAAGDPPYGFGTLLNITGPQHPVLSERVNDSFNALRVQSNEAVGWDMLGNISDALWLLDHRPQPGEERQNWHYTGRAFALNRNLILGFPAPIEIVREDSEMATYWRVYVRVDEDAQNGQLGEPMRRMPWVFVTPEQGDIEAYDRGGRLRDQMPRGYYVDFTQLADYYGWKRAAAGLDWRNNFNARNFWLFHKREGLSWYQAMRELYTDSQLGAWVPTPTPAPEVTPEPDGA